MANECLDECTERTTFVITVSFTDEDDNPVTPTTATYRLDDKESRTTIISSTSIGSPSSSVDIVITSDQNFIIRSRKEYEIRRLTVEFDYEGSGGPSHGTAEYRYKLVNLYGVVDVPSPSVSPSASASPSV